MTLFRETESAPRTGEAMLIENAADDELAALGLTNEVPDVTAMPLRDLFEADNTVLGNAMLRLLADLEEPQQILSAFQSFA